MKKNPSLRLLLALLLSITLLAVGCSTDTTAPSTPPAQTSPAPQTPPDQPASDSSSDAASMGSLASFTATTLSGETFSQENLAEKDLTVVNFWATFCSPCISEMPDLAAFEEALPDHVALITVCLDGGGDLDAVQSILTKAGYNGVTLVSGDGDLGSLANQIVYVPTTVLVDSEGNLVGEPIIGGQKDLAATYLDAVNSALSSAGKAEISLAE